MNLFASLRTALRALRKNKLRSLLAMLGIVIAVGAVVATVSIGQGAQAKVAAQMESLGTAFVVPLRQDDAVTGGASHLPDNGAVACPFDAGKRRLLWI